MLTGACGKASSDWSPVLGSVAGASDIGVCDGLVGAGRAAGGGSDEVGWVISAAGGADTAAVAGGGCGLGAGDWGDALNEGTTRVFLPGLGSLVEGVGFEPT